MRFDATIFKVIISSPTREDVVAGEVVGAALLDEDRRRDTTEI
jgi:hypothetical protein